MKNLKKRLSGFFGGRNFASGVLVALIVAVAVMANALVYTLTAGFELYFTFDSGEPLSVSDGARDTFAEAKANGKKIDIIFCMYEREVENHETGALVYRTAKLLSEKYPDFINLRFVNALTRIEEGTGKPFNFEHYRTQTIKTAEGDEDVTNQFLSTSVIISCETRDGLGNTDDSSFRVITDKYTSSGFADFYSLNADYEIMAFNGDEVFTAMCSWVIHDEHKSAYVTVGHGESPDATLYNALVCAGYYVKEINLKKEDIPTGTSMLIIANPKNDFERTAEGSTIRTELDRLNDYKARGGSFFIMTDPYSKKLPTLTEFVAGFGISPSLTADGQVQIIKDSRDGITNDGFTVATALSDEKTSGEMKDAAGLSSSSVIVRNASPLALSGNAEALLVSSDSSICQAGLETTDREGGYAIAAYSTAKNVGVPDARIFFTSSVYLFANDAMITDGYSNKDFLYSAFDVIFDGGNMPYGCTPVIYDTGVLENLTLGTRILYTAIIMAIPTALAVVGVVVVVRRRNR